MRTLSTVFLALLGLKLISILYESWFAQPIKPTSNLKDFLTEIDEDNDTVRVPDTADDEDDLGELECDCDTPSAFFGNIAPDDDESDEDDDVDYYLPDDYDPSDQTDEEANETRDNVKANEPIVPIDDAIPQRQSKVIIQEDSSTQPIIDIPLKKEAAEPTVESKPVTNFKREGNVIIASDKDFDKVLEEYDYVFVDFFAPWCPHCQALNPHFKKAANKLAEAGSKAVLCKVDITVNSKIRKRYNIRNLPTVKLFKRGQKPIGYPYKKVTGQMVKWVKKQTVEKAKKK